MMKQSVLYSNAKSFHSFDWAIVEESQREVAQLKPTAFDKISVRILDKPIAENGRFLELHSVTWSRENSCFEA